MNLKITFIMTQYVGISSFKTSYYVYFCLNKMNIVDGEPYSNR